MTNVKRLKNVVCYGGGDDDDDATNTSPITQWIERMRFICIIFFMEANELKERMNECSFKEN